jgi:hypothetical protein
MLAWWASRIEFFPFTGLQMYTNESWRSKERIVYYKVQARRRSGVASKAYFDEALGVYATNARYRPTLKKCFDAGQGAERCRVLLQSAGEAYNRKSKPAAQVTELEVQQWSCPADDPLQGTMVDRMVIDLREPGRRGEAPHNRSSVAETDPDAS